MSPVCPETSPRKPSSTVAAFVLSSRRTTTMTLPPFLNTTDATSLPIPLVLPITISFFPRKSDSILLSASVNTSRTDNHNLQFNLSLPTHGTLLAPALWPNGYRDQLPCRSRRCNREQSFRLQRYVEAGSRSGSDIRVPEREIKFRHQLNQTRVNS